MLNLKTLNDVLFTVAASNRERAVLTQEPSGTWQSIRGAAIYQRVRALAEALSSWGIGKGDRVVILGENRWEWGVADFATLAIGAVNVPIYPTLPAGQVADLLVDSRARAAIVSTRQQYDKIVAFRDRTAIERIVLMDDTGTPDAVHFSALMDDTDARGSARDASFDRMAYDVKPEDPATLIYTSGTTGEPKGVVLTHGNVAQNLNYSTSEFGFHDSDRCISFLPLSHITARHLDYAMYAQNVTLAYCPSFERLPAAMQAVKPTILVAVPRVYEKVRQESERRAARKKSTNGIFQWAVKTGAKHRESVAQGVTPSSIPWKLADKLVYKKIQGGFGGKVRYYIAGGAPLGLDTANWFASVGVRILEGYGMTETSPVIGLNTPINNRMGTVGKLLANVNCRVADDGEILVQGPNVFEGYWKQPKHTPDSFDADGFFHTGDIGFIDADGFLTITDRKKELLKTSGGKMIAPQPIENRLKTNLLVAQATLVGDKHKFAAVLISPNFPALEEWAQKHGVSFSTRRDLVQDTRVVAEYQAIVKRANEGLATFEMIKRFKVVPDEWAVESGELTPSLKLKRRVIVEKYAEEIRSFYADEAVAQ